MNILMDEAGMTIDGDIHSCGLVGYIVWIFHGPDIFANSLRVCEVLGGNRG